METISKNIDLKNLDKSTWKAFRFDQIAKKISETINPNETKLEIYAGLEHLDAENIHLKRKGLPSDVKGNKLRCYPGDVIFGKRRAYQRKAAIVDFNGICSAHAFVLRAIPEVIDPNIFIFFLHSDLFMHRAVDISVGGLSPTINWGQLKEQEFILPPKDQQAKLAELLWAMDEVIEKENEVFERLKVNLQSFQKSLFDKEKTQRVRLADYSNVLGGFAFPSKSFMNEGTPVIKIKNLVNGKIEVKDNANHIKLKSLQNIDKYILRQGDILIAMTGATLGKIGIIQKEFDGALLNQRVGKFLIKENVSSWFLRGILDSKFFLLELNKYIGEGAQGNISAEDISKTLVPKVTVSDMNQIGQKFNALYETIKTIESKIASSKSLQKSLINQVF